MAATLKVPTIFTAIDKFTPFIAKMSKAVGTFANKAEAGVARSNRLFRKLTPALSEGGKQLLEYAKSAAIAGAIIGGITFSYQSLKDYETAVASFRTIVSDLDNKAFKPYQNQINQVAKDTKKSSIDVAASFEKIAGLNAKFAETADGIGAVSKAAIILSKAAGEDLGTSAENLVGIMNQFDLSANQANRTINVLAAGTAVGAASISQTSEAFKNFGSTAKGANMSIEQSVALVQTLGKFSIFGAEAGTKLRGATLKLQQAGAGYQSGQFKINDALEQVSKKFAKLRTAREKDAFLLKVFGAENISVGKILMSNIPTIKEFTKGVTGTSEAQRAAEINSSTLTVKLDELKNKFVNLITGSDEASSSLNKAKGVIGFVTDNMETLLSIGTNILIFFAAWKAITLTIQAALFAYNVVLGINAALTGTSSAAVLANSVAMGAATVVTYLAAAANWALAAAVAAATSPIVLIIAAIAAVIAIFYYWDEIVAWFSKKWEQFTTFISSAWDGIVNAFSKFSFVDMFKNIGKSIVDFFLFPLRAVLSLASKIPGAIGKGASNALAGIDKITSSIFVQDETAKKQPLGTPQSKSDQINRENAAQTNTLDININDKNKNVKSTTMKGPLAIPVRISNTQGAN